MTEPRSNYTHYLPPLFQESAVLDGFLLAFERILSQSATGDSWEALETVIAHSGAYLRPLPSGANQRQTPDDFLPWLAGWVALTLRQDLPTQIQRQFISKIVPLYRQRGTKAGLTQMLAIFLGNSVGVTILDHPSELGFTPPAYFFQVQLGVTSQDTNEIRRIQQIAQAIIEQEKPAHTFYGLNIKVPTMRLLSNQLADQLKIKRSPLTLGQNTLLGSK